jgi:DNA-binding IclR family transcriptional regulator
MAATSLESGKMVGALIAGLRVLHYLVRAEAPVGVSQAARDLDISPSTCFNLLRTLVHERFVVFDPVKKTYSIGFGLLELTKGMIDQDQFIKFLRPKLERIASAHRVTGTLWRKLGNDRVVLVDRADAASAVRVHMTVGQRLPMLVGALGRCFAAHSDLQREDVRRQFDQLRWEVPPDFEEFWADVQEARERGYAIDRDHFVRGITTVAAPILDASGAPVMAISAIGFSGQFNNSSLEALAQDLVKDAREIGAGVFPAMIKVG